TLLEEVRILDDRVLSVTPRPAFAPFFRLDQRLREHEVGPSETAGAEADLYRRRKRRGSVLRVPSRVGRLHRGGHARRRVASSSASPKAHLRRTGPRGQRIAPITC